jgi:hypothetical protein
LVPVPLATGSPGVVIELAGRCASAAVADAERFERGLDGFDRRVRERGEADVVGTPTGAPRAPSAKRASTRCSDSVAIASAQSGATNSFERYAASSTPIRYMLSSIVSTASMKAKRTAPPPPNAASGIAVRQWPCADRFECVDVVELGRNCRLEDRQELRGECAWSAPDRLGQERDPELFLRHDEIEIVAPATVIPSSPRTRAATVHVVVARERLLEVQRRLRRCSGTTVDSLRWRRDIGARS